MKKILVATDFSAGSLPALSQALEIARRFSARLLLVHVIHDPAEAPGFYSAKKAGKKVFRNMEQAARQMMEEFADKHMKNFKKSDARVVPGLPAAQIVHLAEKEKVDLIVMGTHGRSGLTRLMLGSVADKVVRSATCPVLTVHAPEKEEKKKKNENKTGGENQEGRSKPGQEEEDFEKDIDKQPDGKKAANDKEKKKKSGKENG